MAERLQCHVVNTDIKLDLPAAVSALAVKCPDGSSEVFGSFYLLAHVSASSGGGDWGRTTAS